VGGVLFLEAIGTPERLRPLWSVLRTLKVNLVGAIVVGGEQPDLRAIQLEVFHTVGAVWEGRGGEGWGREMGERARSRAARRGQQRKRRAR
jgi:hypothetical protein